MMDQLRDTVEAFSIQTVQIISVLNEEMLARSIPLHREHITVLLLTLPHQEFSVILQQLLDFQSGNSSVVPVLLPQRTIYLLHQGEGR